MLLEWQLNQHCVKVMKDLIAINNPSLKMWTKSLKGQIRTRYLFSPINVKNPSNSSTLAGVEWL